MEAGTRLSASILKLHLMSRLILFVFAVLFLLPASAQKKEISQARDYIKSRSSLDKAESSMRELLKDSANRRNLKIYITLAEAVRAQYDVENEKLYLKEKFDTAAFFNTARKMFLAYEGLDSMEAMPDKKGRVKVKLRKKNAALLDRYRLNLYNGGLFFVKRKDYKSAYGLFDTYLDCSKQPLFTDLKYSNQDSLGMSAAFWTVFCGFKTNNTDSALKYRNLALQSPKYRRRTLAILSEVYLSKNDTANYVKALEVGMDENRASKFFFARLMDYYNSKNDLDRALSLSDKALAADKDNGLFLFAKSNVLLNLGKYEECIKICDTLLARKDTLPDIYFNAGASYINMAVVLENEDEESKEMKDKIKSYYKKALPYMESYRVLAPDQKDKWAPFLYNIYLKLNMGKQFEEISGVLQKLRK